MREKALPTLDDAFAKLYEAESLDKLREGVRKDLENELKYKLQRDTRGQIVKGLLEKVNFDLPEGAVANETRNVVYNLVQENAKRGVPRDMIEGWVATATQYNPLTAILEAGRSLMAGDPFHLLLAFGAAAGLAMLMVAFAKTGLRRAEAEAA